MSRIFRRFAACAVAVIAVVSSINLYAAEGNLTFTVSGYTGSATFTGFPVLVRLSENNPAGFSYFDCAADGADIVFYTANDNEVPVEIPYEINTWNTSGESLIWVRLPSMTAGTKFLMNYGGGNSRTTAATATWSDYGAVFHLEEPGDALTDATTGIASGTRVSPPVGTAPGTSVDPKEGNFGGGHGSTGNANFKNGPIFKFPMNSTLFAVASQNSASFSISGWYRAEGSRDSIWNWLFSTKYNDNDTGFGVQFRGSGTGNKATGKTDGLALWPYIGNTPDGSGNNATWFVGGTAKLFDGAWEKYDLVVNGNKATMYVNGDVIANGEKTLSKVPQFAMDHPFCVGGHRIDTLNGTGARTTQASVDEFRIRTECLSADFIAAQYATESSSSFLTAQYKAAAAFSVRGSLPVYDSVSGKWEMDVVVSSGSGTISCKLVDGNNTESVTTLDTGVGEGEYTYDLPNLDSDTVYSVSIIGDDGNSATTNFVGAFYNGEISITGGDDADFASGQNGTFTISRANGDASCGANLTVNYTVGGSAEGGADYKALSGTAVILVGQSSVVIEVEPLFHPSDKTDATILLTLASGGYRISGVNGSDEIAYVVPEDRWMLAANRQTMSDCNGIILTCSVDSDNEVTVNGMAPTSIALTVLDLAKGFFGSTLVLTKIKYDAFNSSATLTEVKHPETLVRISDRAFISCAEIGKGFAVPS